MAAGSAFVLSGEQGACELARIGFTLHVPRRFDPDLNDIKRTDLAALSRKELEDLAWRLHELARSLANRLGEDSTTSSRPPSSDDPYRRDQRGEPAAADPDGGRDRRRRARQAGKPEKKKTAKPAGKRPGRKGIGAASRSW